MDLGRAVNFAAFRYLWGTGRGRCLFSPHSMISAYEGFFCSYILLGIFRGFLWSFVAFCFWKACQAVGGCYNYCAECYPVKDSPGKGKMCWVVTIPIQYGIVPEQCSLARVLNWAEFGHFLCRTMSKQRGGGKWISFSQEARKSHWYGGSLGGGEILHTMIQKTTGYMSHPYPGAKRWQRSTTQFQLSKTTICMLLLWLMHVFSTHLNCTKFNICSAESQKILTEAFWNKCSGKDSALAAHFLVSFLTWKAIVWDGEHPLSFEALQAIQNMHPWSCGELSNETLSTKSSCKENNGNIWESTTCLVHFPLPYWAL